MGRDDVQGALVLDPCRWVHTLGMRFPLDIAFVDADGTVIKILHMHQWRVGMPVLRARSVIEAEHGAFERWGLQLGDEIDVRGG